MEQNSVEVTEELVAQMRAVVKATRGTSGLWFLCHECERLHYWMGGPFRCYPSDKPEVEDPPVAAGVVCNCPSKFCPAHGKADESEARKGRKVRG